MTKPRIIIISAPSGTGKSTVIERIIRDPRLRLQFSISATSRAPRGQEKEGVHYYFISAEEFQARIREGLFLEYVEVYPGCFYGTPKQELERIHADGDNLLLDIDVEGALLVKKQYPSETLAIFLAPPSPEVLRDRLTKRGTDSPEVIEERLKRASYELTLAPNFDIRIVNDDLDTCCKSVSEAISRFIGQNNS